MLVQPDYVHISFHEHATVDFPAAEFIQSVKFTALVEHRCLRAVHVLGLDIAHGAAAEAGHAAAAVADREHDAVAEAVIEVPGVALARQARVDQLAVLVVRLTEARRSPQARNRDRRFARPSRSARGP